MPAPAHDVVLATIRDFVDRSGALRVAVVFDGGGDGVLIEAEPGEPLVVNDEYAVPPAQFAGTGPLYVALPKPVPATALHADPVTGEVEAPIGVLHGLADAVADLARALGGRTVALAEFATRDGAPLSVAARPGEAPVLGIGEQQFTLPDSA